MARGNSSHKVANSLVAMSSAAVLAVYSAGYVRTKPAAEQLAKQALERSMRREAPPIAAVPDRPTEMPDAAKTTTDSNSDKANRPSHSKPAPVATPDPVPASVTPAVVAQNGGTAPVSNESPEPATVAPPTPVSETQPAAVPIVPPPPPAPKVWKDGKYTGWGGSRHGDIQATIVIEGGRIISAEISDCQTRYPCDVIEKLPPQVITRQSPNVQRISGATESSDAFYSAVFFALDQAK